MTTLAPHDFVKARQTAIDAALLEVTATFPLVCGHGGTYELRALRDGAIASGYYDAAHMEAAALAAATLDADGWNVFVTLNPCADGVLARASNRMRTGRGKMVTTGDADIARRRWLLIDLDPQRPSETSSSKAQWKAAQAKAQAMKDALVSEGWPEPLWASSGNGAHLLYRIDLRNDRESTDLLRGVLATFARRFDDAPETANRVRVDTAVFNAARISTLYGTMKRKGDDTEQFPHRRSQSLAGPPNPLVVPLALLRATAGTRAANCASADAGADSSWRQWMQDWLGRSGVTVVRESNKEGAHLWTLAACPFNPEHKDAAVIHGEHGYAYKCFHASCVEHDWHALRAKIEGAEATTRPTCDATPSDESRQVQPAQNVVASDLAKLIDAANAVPRVGATPVGTKAKPTEHWWVVGCGLHWASDGTSDALTAWQAWLPERAEECARVWPDLKAPCESEFSPITAATIFKLAVANGWNGLIEACVATVSSADAPWPELQSLIVQHEAKPYPFDALPNGIRAAVQEVRDFVQAPDALVACSALSVLSLAAQGLADVRRAERLSGPISLYFMAVGDSGERKSACDGFFTKVLHEWERQQAEAAKPDLAKHRAAFGTWTAKIDGVLAGIKGRARSGKPAAELDPLERLQSEKPEPPRVPRLIFSDATPEALAWGLAHGWPSGGVMSNEAGIVFGGHAMSSESAMRNMGLLNTLWDGGRYKVERKTSPSYTLQGARLTMGLAVQPDTVSAFFEGTKGLARGIGFAARFLFAWPTTTQGSRSFRDPPATWTGVSAYMRRIGALLDLSSPVNANGELEPPMLDFSPTAKALWVQAHDDIERKLGHGGDMADVADVASKAADNLARMAALFHLFENGPAGVISEQHVRAAAQIVAWHLYEAQRFLGAFALPKALGNAVKLDAWLVKHCLHIGADAVPTGDVLRLGPNALRDKKILDEAIAYLAEASRARLVLDGRRKLLQLNPALLLHVPLSPKGLMRLAA